MLAVGERAWDLLQHEDGVGCCMPGRLCPVNATPDAFSGRPRRKSGPAGGINTAFFPFRQFGTKVAVKSAVRLLQVVLFRAVYAGTAKS